jgi:hypothetical protein
VLVLSPMMSAIGARGATIGQCVALRSSGRAASKRPQIPSSAVSIPVSPSSAHRAGPGELAAEPVEVGMDLAKSTKLLLRLSMLTVRCSPA